MHQNVGNMSQNFLGKLNTLYSKRACKVISFNIRITILGIILRNISPKYAPTRTKLHHFLKFSWANKPPDLENMIQ